MKVFVASEPAEDFTEILGVCSSYEKAIEMFPSADIDEFELDVNGEGHVPCTTVAEMDMRGMKFKEPPEPLEDLPLPPPPIKMPLLDVIFGEKP